MEWWLILAGGVAAVVVGHGVLVLAYACGPHAAVARRMERYIAGGE